ncbi:hypothetical protein OsJ_27508 [Oryza sativa Japonica Group]|uniref:Uncharacterized protein n=1 Tax=Oryza sativa subsp. japonica TaxID=39947 RepID=A3BTM9_ORYSJ|nr:hypothetical protein OsJ_27508 [Oryza sativa Japonica Group]
MSHHLNPLSARSPEEFLYPRRVFHGVYVPVIEPLDGAGDQARLLLQHLRHGHRDNDAHGVEVLRGLLRQPGDAALYGGLDGVGGAGVDGVIMDGGERGVEGGRPGEERRRQDVELAAEDEDAVRGGVRVEPPREREGGSMRRNSPSESHARTARLGNARVSSKRRETPSHSSARESPKRSAPWRCGTGGEAQSAQGEVAAVWSGGGMVSAKGVAVEKVGGEEGGEVGRKGKVEGPERGVEVRRREGGGEGDRVDGV